MITKAAYLTGAIRATNLSDEQKAALRKHYGLKEDANLTLRNMGRDAVGGISGAVAGGALGGVAGGAIGGMPGAALGGTLGWLGGAGLGIKHMTDKYSVGNAKRIMQAKTEDAQ